METVQITFFDKNKKYKPIARIVNCKNWEDYLNNKQKYQLHAILQICHTMHLTPEEFKKQGYTLVKADTLSNIRKKKLIYQMEKLHEKREKNKNRA